MTEDATPYELVFWLESPLGKEEKVMDVDSWEVETTRFHGENILKVTKPDGEEAELKIPTVKKLRFLDGSLVGLEAGFGREDLADIEAFFGSEFPLTRKGIALLEVESG